jgi:hypothetical protein
MAFVTTVNNYVSEGLRNAGNGQKMVWYRTNFNMPVPQLDSGNPPTPYNNSTYYDLSSFSPGFEICVGMTIWTWTNSNTVTTWNLSTNLYQFWAKPNGQPYFYNYNGYHIGVSIPPGYYTFRWGAANTGCASWEVGSSGLYQWNASSNGNGAGSAQTYVSMSGVPNVNPVGTPGYIWVEGASLSYINASGWKHSIPGSYVGPSGLTPGYFWMDVNSNLLHWIGSNGQHYQAPWRIQQIASTWSNGATGSVYGGTANTGKIWVDTEWGYTHLAYIGIDGYKYITGAGNYPY